VGSGPRRLRRRRCHHRHRGVWRARAASRADARRWARVVRSRPGSAHPLRQPRPRHERPVGGRRLQPAGACHRCGPRGSVGRGTRELEELLLPVADDRSGGLDPPRGSSGRSDQRVVRRSLGVQRFRPAVHQRVEGRGDLRRLSGRSRCGSPAFPSLAAPGANLPFAALGRPTAYAVGGGTSLAAGLVGGAAALILQADPELGPAEVERLLVETARPLPPPNEPDATGAGGVDLRSVPQRIGLAPGTERSSPPGERREAHP